MDPVAPSMEQVAGGVRGKLKIDAGAFAEHFDRRPFYIEHDLQSHSLFELSAMAELSKRLPGWVVEGEYGLQNRPPPVPIDQAILCVGERPTWVLLRQIQLDPLYGRLVDELLDQIQHYSEPLNPGMCQREAFLFISSQDQVTGLHFDPEYNFLLQMRGRKKVQQWDPHRHEVISDAAIDAFYADFRSNRDQPYRDEFLDSVLELPLEAGQGLHFPLHAPHVVHTVSDVSVSLSITFRTRESRSMEAVHITNGYVRRLGITPPGPGDSRLWDAAGRVGRFGHGQVQRARLFAGRWGARIRRRISLSVDP